MPLFPLSSTQPSGWQIENGNTTNTDKDQRKQISPHSKRPRTAPRDRRQERPQPHHRRHRQGPESDLFNPRKTRQIHGDLVDRRQGSEEQVALVPEFFTLLGIEIFLGISVLSGLLDRQLPSRLQYIFQGLGGLGF